MCCRVENEDRTYTNRDKREQERNLLNNEKPFMPKLSGSAKRKQHGLKLPLFVQRLLEQAATHHFPQHFLNFFPLPQGHGSLRPVCSASSAITTPFSFAISLWR
jgi:hypothetical protein